LTLQLLGRLLDEMVVVEEEAIVEAMLLLLERSKLLVEGAGAAALGALLSRAVKPAARGTTVAIVSGGNVDIGALAALALRAETGAGRRLRLYTRVPDRPGGLAAMLQVLASAGGNVLSVEHVRDGVPLPIGETGVELTLATRSGQHSDVVIGALESAGYVVEKQG
jgi:threonine dehydratase